MIPSYVSGFIYSALLDSFCSEQNARMTAMDAANQNAEELLAGLKLQYNRVRQAAIFTMGAAFCMLVVLVALCWVDSDALIRLFRDDPEVTAVALPAFHYQCLAILLQPVIVVANMTFQSVGKAGRATFLACCRQGVFFIPLILILPRTFGLVGVEICQPIADALTFIVSLPFLLAFLKQLDRMDDAEKAKAQS